MTCEALHEKLNRENPQPLTIEQLKQRIGKPVFVMRNTAGCSAKFGGWRVLSKITLTLEEYRNTVCELNWTGGGAHEYEHINCYDYDITCYDHEPKEGEK